MHSNCPAILFINSVLMLNSKFSTFYYILPTNFQDDILCYYEIQRKSFSSLLYQIFQRIIKDMKSVFVKTVNQIQRTNSEDFKMAEDFHRTRKIVNNILYNIKFKYINLVDTKRVQRLNFHNRKKLRILADENH